MKGERLFIAFCGLNNRAQLWVEGQMARAPGSWRLLVFITVTDRRLPHRHGIALGHPADLSRSLQGSTWPPFQDFNELFSWQEARTHCRKDLSPLSRLAVVLNRDALWSQGRPPWSLHLTFLLSRQLCPGLTVRNGLAWVLR